MPIAKTPNQAWKESGTTLGFTQWLHREKEKMYYSNGDDVNNTLLVNKPLNDSIKAAIDGTLKQGGLKTKESGKTVFGIKKIVLIGAGVAVAAAIIYIIVKNVKKPI